MLGALEMSYTTTLDLYTFAIPAHQHELVQKLGDLLTNVDESR